MEDRGRTVPRQKLKTTPGQLSRRTCRPVTGSGPDPAEHTQPVPASWQSVEGEARERAECCENAANVTMLLWGEIL